MITVSGYCPFGCGKTLFLAQGNHVTCSYAHCPCPTGVADLLEDDASITDHTVEIREFDFAIQHPLSERIQGDLIHCGLHEFLSGLDFPPKLGIYRASQINGSWHFYA